MTHKHSVGIGIAHRGDIPHGTFPVKKGERVQLAIKFRSAPAASSENLAVVFSHFFKPSMTSHLQQLALVHAGACGVTKFCCASRGARVVASEQLLWRELYEQNSRLCELVPVGQLLSDPATEDERSSTFAEQEELGLLQLEIVGYKLAYIRDVRLLDGDWRTAYRVVQANCSVVGQLQQAERPKRSMGGLRRGGLRRAMIGFASVRPSAGTDRWKRETKMQVEQLFNEDSEEEYNDY